VEPSATVDLSEPGGRWTQFVLGFGDQAVILLGAGTRLLAVVVVMCVMVVLVRGCPLDRAKLIARTSQEVRTAYGEPDLVIDHRAHHPDVKEVYWHYRYGLLGESRVTLREDVVVNVSSRVGK
jgi:hypothetical protein